MNLTLTDEEKKSLRTTRTELLEAGALNSFQLDFLHKKNLFNLYVPKYLGGLEMPLPEALELQEQLANIDGSVGWTLTLCSGAAWFAGFLDPSLAQRVFQTPRVCIGGSGAATGIAEVDGSGYRVNGTWKFATGAPHLTHFTANCQLCKNGVPLVDAHGNLRVASFIFEKQEVQIIPDWRGMGLTATGSHSFAIKNLWVPVERCFYINAQTAVVDQPIYRFPFVQFAEVTLAVNFCGMASHFLHLAVNIVSSKDAANAALIERLIKQVNDVRREFYEYMAQTWDDFLSAPASLTNPVQLTISRFCKMLTSACYKSLYTAYPFCGMEGADTDSYINTIWRDLNTASQHVLVQVHTEHDD